MNLRPPGYEPGELPGCSTPRRGGQYTRVDWLFWLGLGVLVVAIVGGLAYVGVQGWRAWVAFTSFAAGSAAGLERLAQGVDRASGKADRLTARLTELDAAVARLQRAVRQVRILSDALTEVRETIALIRTVLPV